VDGPVVEAGGAQRVEVGRSDLVLAVSELRCELTKRAIRLRQRCASPVTRYGVHASVGGFWHHRGDLVPEVVRMSLRSIVAAKLGRDHGRQELSLRSAERGVAFEERSVECHAVAKRFRVHAHDVNDVPHAAGALLGGVELVLEKTRRLVYGDLTKFGTRCYRGPIRLSCNTARYWPLGVSDPFFCARYCAIPALTLSSIPIRPISAVAFVGSPVTPESGLPPRGASFDCRMPAG